VSARSTYLDTLINFDSIVTIYCNVTPPAIENDPDPEKYGRISDLFTDSIRRKWTYSKTSIDNFRRAFPKLKKTDNPNWDTTCLWYKEYLIVTPTKLHTVGWLLTDKDSLVAFDDISYSIGKNDLEKLTHLLDRPIILKEIYRKDSAQYNTIDFYNRHYSGQINYFGYDKMHVYILK